MKKPKIFISSTIHDFKDLRSALKFYLQNLGFDVLLSEYNDFQKELDPNAFEACLQSLIDVDYYILLVGNRVGAFYDQGRKVSITQKEYQTAYEYAKKKQLKMVMFVRKELWDIRTDRKALNDYLNEEFKKTREITEDEIKQLVSHKSDFINDAEFLFNFIDEISRKDEVDKATKKEGAFPPANWVHTFSSFEDIIDTLRVEFEIKISLSEAALRENLKSELLRNLLLLSYKHEKHIGFYHWYVLEAKNHFKGKLNETSKYPAKDIKSLVLFFLFGFGGQSNLQTKFMDEAIISGHFLEYNTVEDKFQSSPLLTKLDRLVKEIVTYKSLATLFKDSQIELIKRFGGFFSSPDDQLISVPNLDLFVPFLGYGCLRNIEILTIASLKDLDGNSASFESLKLEEINPSSEMAEKAKAGFPTVEEMKQFVNDYPL